MSKKILLLAFLITGIISCSKTEDVSPSDPLLGKWKFSKIEINLDNEKVIPSKASLEESDFSTSTYEFKNDNVIIIDGDETNQSTYVYDENAKSLIIKDPNTFEKKFQVELVESKLSLSSPIIETEKVPNDIDFNTFDGMVLFKTVLLIGDDYSTLAKYASSKKINLKLEYTK